MLWREDEANRCVICDMGDGGVARGISDREESWSLISRRSLRSSVRRLTLSMGTSRTACRKMEKSVWMSLRSGRQSRMLSGRFVRTSGMRSPFLSSSCFYSGSTLSAQRTCV